MPPKASVWGTQGLYLVAGAEGTGGCQRASPSTRRNSATARQVCTASRSPAGSCLPGRAVTFCRQRPLFLVGSLHVRSIQVLSARRACTDRLDERAHHPALCVRPGVPELWSPALWNTVWRVPGTPKQGGRQHAADLKKGSCPQSARVKPKATGGLFPERALPPPGRGSPRRPLTIYHLSWRAA